MIKINLIPDELRNPNSKLLPKGNIIPREVVFGVGGVLVILLILTHVTLAVVTMAQIMNQKKVSGAWEAKAEDKKMVDDILKNIENLKARDAQLKELTKYESVVWSRNLNIISDLLPKGVWIRYIHFDQNVLRIEGTAVSKMRDEMITVGSLASLLKNSDDFMRAFMDVEVESIERQEDAGDDIGVVEFSLLIKGKHAATDPEA